MGKRVAGLAVVVLGMGGPAFAGALPDQPVPVLSEHGMILLGLGLAAVGVAAFRRRRR
jgi:hypothetical protein